jgi:hypothetical protein
MVPAPSIQPTLPSQRSSNFGRWDGPVVATGAGPQALNIDLKFLTKQMRSTANLRENMRITVESKDPNLKCPSPGDAAFTPLAAVFFDGPDEPNEYVQILVEGITGPLTGAERCIVEVQQVHTVIR